MDVVFIVRDFISRSMRVMAVATKPRRAEYEKIAKVTALGTVVIGILGLMISFVFRFI